MLRSFFVIVLFLLLASAAALRPRPAQAGPSDSTASQEGTPTPIPPAPSPDELIAAVNALRLTYGLLPLTPHPILMKVAQDQAYVLADSEGAAGHQRPSGISLTDYLLLLGYPLAGDLSQGGYRAENWTYAGPNVQEAISAWMEDELHRNTMLKDVYRDIGAGISFSTDEWGITHYYYVIDCAMPTASGRPQNYTPAAILTATAYAAFEGTPQWMIPIALSTARPDGDVVHEVLYGQTLWSLAEQYRVSVQQIKQLNGLAGDTILPGWKLVLQKGATQPAPQTEIPLSFELHGTSLPTSTPSVTPSAAPTAERPSLPASQFVRQNSVAVAALLIALSVLVAGIIAWGGKKP